MRRRMIIRLDAPLEVVRDAARRARGEPSADDARAECTPDGTCTRVCLERRSDLQVPYFGWLHATLTGVSAAFDAVGRCLLWRGTERRGLYRVDIPITGGTTLYTRVGDWVSFAALATLAAGGAVAGLRRWQRRAAAARP